MEDDYCLCLDPIFDTYKMIKTRSMDTEQPSQTVIHGREELLRRARLLTGCTLGELAQRYGITLASSPIHSKGQIGELFEHALNATAGNAPIPDFPELGVELKTIPLQANRSPIESTFVCSISLKNVEHEEWKTSRVRAKLSCILWVPIESTKKIPIEERRVLSPLLWSPSPEQEAILKADFEELMGYLGSGHAEEISAHLGRWLQVRPKAANSRVRVTTWARDGEPVWIVPCGFYLRTAFTKLILENL